MNNAARVAGYVVGYIHPATDHEGTLVTHNDAQVDYQQPEAETKLRGAWLTESLQGLDNPRAFRLYALVELPVEPVCGACGGTGRNDIGERVEAEQGPRGLGDILSNLPFFAATRSEAA